MGTVDRSGNHHTSAGRAGAGQFAQKTNTPPAGGLSSRASTIDATAAAASAEQTLLWSSSEVEQWQTEHDGADVRLSDESKLWLAAEIEDFTQAYPDLVAEARAAGYTSSDGDGFEGAFGHDFVLTRDHHGAGFWDRPELEKGDLGRRLSDAVQKRVEISDSVFVDDDGMVMIDNSYARTRQGKIEGHLRFAESMGVLSHSVARDELMEDGSYRLLSYRTQARLNQDG